MTGLALVWGDGRRDAAATVHAMLKAMSHRGRGDPVVFSGNRWALGCVGLYGTPMVAVDAGIHVAIDGWLAEPDALIQRLGMLPEVSDAHIVLVAYQRWGAALPVHVHGALAGVIVDTACRRVLAFRDYLGQKPLVYAHDGRCHVVASEESALVRGASVPATLCDRWLAGYFSLQGHTQPLTAFEGIKDILPGQVLSIDGERTTRQRLACPFGRRPIHHRHIDHYTDELLERLTRAARRCSRTHGSLGVMLSGGMDSTTAAAMVAPEMTGPHRIAAYSWTIPRYPDADEAPFIVATARHLGIDCMLFDGQAMVDGAPDVVWPVVPDTPVVNLYRSLICGSYAQAATAGCSVILNADSADRLYGEPGEWLLAACRDHAWGVIAWELCRLVLTGGPLALRRDRGVVRALRGLLRLPNQSLPSEWLTPYARGLLDQTMSLPTEIANSPWPKRAAVVLGFGYGQGISRETRFTYPFGLDRRDVFRDPDVVDFFLSIPSHWIHRPGAERTKFLVRHAMNGRLPEEVRRRPRGGVLSAIARDALHGRQAWMESVLWRGERQWPRFVCEDWLRGRWSGTDETSLIVTWQCLCFERWLQVL